MSSTTDNTQNLIKNSDIPVESSSSSTTTTSDKENGPVAPVSQTKESETTTTATTSPQTINSTTTPSTTAKNTTTTRRRKKKVGMACVYCRRSHMICDEGRPCQRCMKRKIGHLCHDEPASTKTRKKQKKENGSIESDNNNDENSGDEDTEQSTEPESVITSSSTSTATVPETTVSETTTTTTTTSPNSLIRQKLGAPLKMGATFDVKFYNEATENSNNQGIREYSDNKDFRNYTNERGAFTTETDESTSNTEISTQQQQQQQQPEPNNNNNNNNNSNNSQQNNINKTTGFSNTNSKVHLNQYNGMNNNNNNNNSNFYNKSATGSVPQSSTSLNQQPFFYSEHAGSEFNSLTEFLSMIDDTDMINSINLNNDPMLAKLENATSSQLGSYNNSSTNLHTQFLEQTGMAQNNNMNGHNNENINSNNNNNNNNSNNNGNSRTNNKSNISNSVLSSMGFTVPSSTNINQFNNMYKTPNDSTSNFIQPSLPPLQQQQQQQQHQNVDQMQPHQQSQRMDLHQSSSNNMLIQSPYVGRQQQSQQQQQQQQQLPYDRHSVNNRQLQIHNSNNNSATNFSSQTSQSQSQSHNQTPVISDAARDKFFLTAADPTTEVSPEERLKQVISAKLEAGLLKPYNYAKGYARLQTYMDNHMNASSRQRILKPLSTFRPGFRAIAKTLKDIDLILVEEAFERMLLDYDRVFTSMAIPACLWRRTGEIYRGNKEFASLVEVSIDDLKNGKLTIYELMSEESSVNFWEKYGSIAFDKTQKAVLTSCNLKSKDGRKKKNCCFSFTIRRDRYNIPSCIVGNFIPISN